MGKEIFSTLTFFPLVLQIALFTVGGSVTGCEPQTLNNIMALPHLITYVYTNGTDEVIRRGKKIHAIGYVELVEYDELFESVTFRVKDDSYARIIRYTCRNSRMPKRFLSAVAAPITWEISVAMKPAP